MTRHDESQLWEYAARELEPEEARLVQHHLSECPECQEKLSDVRTAQGALKAARTGPLALGYRKVDAALSKVIDRRLQAQAMGRRWVLALSGGLVAVGAALVAFGLWPKAVEPLPLPVAPVVVEAPRVVPTVESAEALTRVGVTSEVVRQGAGLESGDVLKTAARGKATLRLPEGTRLAMTGDTQLSLTRVQRDVVALTLERGHVAVAASHARERKGFVVHANGLMVTVVGTVFSMSSSRDVVEVSVSEGRVSVEAPEGLPQFVSAGQRVQFETRHWRSSRGPLPASEKKELAALVAPAPVLAPAAAPAAPVVATVHTASVPASGGSTQAFAIEELVPLPAPEKKAEAPVLPPAAEQPVAEQPVAVQPVAAPPPAPVKAPDMSGLEVPLLVSPVESVGRPPEQSEWAQMPSKPAEPLAAPAVSPPVMVASAAPVQAPAAEPKRRTPTYAPSFEPAPASPTASKLTNADEGIPQDSQGIFLQRAERSLRTGTCERYLLGLEEVANDRRSPDAERARLYRARCFDAVLKPKQAYQEYRRYLQQYPTGHYVDEARQVMGEMD